MTYMWLSVSPGQGMVGVCNAKGHGRKVPLKAWHAPYQVILGAP